MVRRWSYLNQINFKKDLLPNTVGSGDLTIQALHQVTFKATTYYRKPLYNPLITKITRKSFFRRKHLNSWVIYQNILTLWAKEYLFFRKYARVVLAFFFFKNNILTYNLLVHSNTSIDKIKGLEGLHITHLVRSIGLFCQFRGKSLFPFFTVFKNFSLFLGSTNLTNDTLKKLLPTNLEPLYTVSPSQLTSQAGLTTKGGELGNIFSLFFQTQTAYYIEVYRLWIFLIWFTLKP